MSGRLPEMENTEYTPLGVFHESYSMLRMAAELRRIEAADDDFLAIIHSRLRQAMRVRKMSLERRGQIRILLTQTNSFMFSLLSDDAPDRTEERMEALQDGMALHVAAWAISRTVEALHGDVDHPMTIVDIASRYVQSPEGKQEAEQQMMMYLEGTMLHEPCCLPDCDVVLEFVHDELATVCGDILDAELSETSPSDGTVD